MWSRGEKRKMTETANYYLRLNLFLAVPAAIVLLVMAEPMIELLFQRGRFSVADTAATASVLQVYAFILISSSCVRVLVPGFYAVKNTWLPAVASGLSLLVHILVAPWLMQRWGLRGLVSSSFVSASLNLSLLLGAYRIWIGTFGFMKLLESVCKFVVSGLGLWAVLRWYSEIHSWIGLGRFGLFFAVFFTMGVGGLVYALLAWLLRCEELTQTVGTVLAKILRRWQRKTKSQISN
jgi:putative peptidoglycan lipid II flippase